eukprot:15485731-Alexandrium_andersonii.AAC.1
MRACFRVALCPLLSCSRVTRPQSAAGACRAPEAVALPALRQPSRAGMPLLSIPQGSRAPGPP